MRRLLPLACIVAFAATALADAPKIVGPESIGPYRLIYLSVEGDIDSAVFQVYPFQDVDQKDGDDQKSAIIVAPPGTYTIFATTLKGGKLGKAQKLVTVTGQPAPVPTPTPTPGPPPDPRPPPAPPAPTPIAAGWHATLVRDANGPLDSLRALATFAESPTIEKSIGDMGGYWHVTDRGSAEFNRRKLSDAMAKEDPSGPPVVAPCLIIQDALGNVIKKSPVDVTRGDGIEKASVDYIRSVVGAR